MRAPEEVAREAYAAAEQTYDALREFGPKMSPGEVRERMIHAIATHLRARDAEVRADERAKALAEVKGKALDHRQIIAEGPLVSRLLVSHWCNEALLNPTEGEGR